MGAMQHLSVVLIAFWFSAPWAQAGSCHSTQCYGANCDHWDGGHWGTCAKLASHYGCDCSGCTCDGCLGTCGTPHTFDVNQCPAAGNSLCDPKHNNAECAWDGGDCCESTCIGTSCGTSFTGYDCKDPNAPNTASTRRRRSMAERHHGSQDTPRKPILLSYQREDNNKSFGIMVVVLMAVVGGCLCIMTLVSCCNRSQATGHVQNATATIERVITALDSCTEEPPPHEQCSICLSDVGTIAGGGLLLHCGHPFHKACLVAWLRGGGAAGRSATCPLCKQGLPGGTSEAESASTAGASASRSDAIHDVAPANPQIGAMELAMAALPLGWQVGSVLPRGTPTQTDEAPPAEVAVDVADVHVGAEPRVEALNRAGF